MEPEETRAAELREAQSKAEQLFNQIEERGLIRPGITEKDLNADIYALAKEM
jgi:Xaa-Pro dipeptidase